MTTKPPFEAVVQAHGRTVLRVCRALLRAPDADDAWSETFLAALRAYPELPADANVEAWLVTIAHRKAIDAARAAARRAVPVAEVPEPARGRPGPGFPALPGSGAGDLDLDPDLGGALAGLTSRQRAVLAYHYLAGLPYAEIARLTGGTAAAARRAAADGIARLRQSCPPGRTAGQAPAATPVAGQALTTPALDQEASR